MDTEEQEGPEARPEAGTMRTIIARRSHLELLAQLQLRRNQSSTDFTVKCLNGEIPIHELVLRAWILKPSINPRRPQEKDPHCPNLKSLNKSIDLSLFTVEEIAPLIFALYYERRRIRLNVKARQAFQILNEFLRKSSQVEIDPSILFHDNATAQVISTDAKLRCVKDVNDVKQHYHYIISRRVFLEMCGECDFAGTREELERHFHESHPTVSTVLAAGTSYNQRPSGFSFDEPGNHPQYTSTPMPAQAELIKCKFPSRCLPMPENLARTKSKQ